ncbi:MAG: GMC family oxidoreductase [Myxococcales bacterium]|nr:GMC family oxidoreductase [Myxococcales bacterium]
MKSIDLKRSYDAIVVGSGAAGGMAAYALVKRGVEVLMLEAGPLEPIASFEHHKQPWQYPLRGELEIERKRELEDFGHAWNQRLLIGNTKAHPYASAKGTRFKWRRVRAVGGKTLIWALISLRLSPRDFKAASADGWGEDWPISYDDIAPYYERVERLIGVCGNRDNLPNNPDSVFLPPVPLSCAELVMKKAVDRFEGRRLINGRAAALTVPHNGRPACHYCGHCDRICQVSASFSSLGVLMPWLLRQKNFHLRTGSVVSEVLLDKQSDRARGVRFIDHSTRKRYEAKGRVVVLGASCLETTRLLLNSRSKAWPTGLGNASGTLGKYFSEHIITGVTIGFAPSLRGRKAAAQARPNGSPAYIPRFRNLDGTKRDFLRGYGFQFVDWANDFPSYAPLIKGFGSQLKHDIKRNFGTALAMAGFGEVLPDARNSVQIDPTIVDQYGIPSLRFDVRRRDNEKKMAADIAATAEEMMRAAGVEIISGPRKGISTPGDSVHELGTCRMGLKRETSMLDANNRMHELRNVFVVDGSSFTSASEKNPTLTILALAYRAAEHIAASLKRREL